MKTMTCKQLGGPCDKEFHAETFEEMIQQSKNHGMELFQKGDEEHTKVMNDMKKHMNEPNAMQHYVEQKKKIFDSLPDS